MSAQSLQVRDLSKLRSYIFIAMLIYSFAIAFAESLLAKAAVGRNQNSKVKGNKEQ